MSIINRCRLCLKLCRHKVDVFKDDFPKMIEMLTGLKVDPYDDFPKTSCLECAKNVKGALKTRKQIIKSHKALLEEFLAKCRETRIFEPQISENKPAIIDQRVNQADETIALPTLKVTRSKKSKIIDQKEVGNSYEVIKPSSTIKGDIPENPSVFAEQKFEIVENEVRESIDLNFFPDGSNSCNTPSPISDPGLDIDWEPGKEPAKLVKQETKSSKSPPKPSEEVVFVKRHTTRKPKSLETIVRIKKKPKGRVPPKRVTCDICKREVQSYWLQKHMETHEYNPVTCEFCGLVSKSATALRHHVFYYHRSAADEYMCDQCGRSFRSKYRLNLHKKKEHGGTKDFECTTCGKKFFERMHLKRHVDKTHKNIRPYVCDFCGKCFKSKNHIKIHERIHSKEAPYNCHMCGESFKMKLTLRTHLKGIHNVHEEQKVFCDICKRGFASDIALKAHLNSRIHETEKCQYCSEMFTREYMVNHLRDVHGIGDSL